MNPRNIEQLHVAGGVFGDRQNMTKHGDNRVIGAAKIGTLDILTSGFSQSTCCEPPRPSSADDLRLQKLSSKLFLDEKPSWDKILRQHLINYLAHARCLCSEPELPSPNILSSCVLQRVIICQFVTEHSNYINTNKWTTMGLGDPTHLQRRRTKCAMRSILWST